MVDQPHSRIAETVSGLFVMNYMLGDAAIMLSQGRQEQLNPCRKTGLVGGSVDDLLFGNQKR